MLKSMRPFIAIAYLAQSSFGRVLAVALSPCIAAMLFEIDQLAKHTCAFCLKTNEERDESGRWRKTKHYGETCIACNSCEQLLWMEHVSRTDVKYMANHICTAGGVYSGAKKMRTNTNQPQTLLDEQCKAFYDYVICKWRVMGEQHHQLAVHLPFAQQQQQHQCQQQQQQPKKVLVQVHVIENQQEAMVVD